MADLRERLRADLKLAMRARDTVRRDTIRMLEAVIKNAEIAARAAPDDAAIAVIVQKQVSQRRESIEQFHAAGRSDLEEREAAEIAVLEAYLPSQLSRAEIVAAAQAAIAQVAAAGLQDRGKVMGVLMAELRGKADGHLVNEVVAELLGG